MGDDDTNQKKRKVNNKWKTPHPNITAAEAEKRLGIRVRLPKGTTVETSLANAKHSVAVGIDVIKKTKEKVYDRILEHLKAEGYPTEGDPDPKEANINDLVHAIINPILFEFIRQTGRETIQLWREKEIISVDGETRGTEEFIVLNLISVIEEKLVSIMIAGAKRPPLGKALRQCLLAMKDMGDNNGGGDVYGFVTTWQHWQVKYIVCKLESLGKKLKRHKLAGE